jgi:dihydroorotate dehydrogenase
MDAEQAHHRTMSFLVFISQLPLASSILRSGFAPAAAKAGKQVDRLNFPNVVGLAAGFDKNGEWVDVLANLGFGFIEVGTITPKAQAGNPKPRLFRLIPYRALINRMGFNNQGVKALVENLKKVKNKEVIIGGNIGKNKDTANENAIHDYVICFEALYDYVHYFVINVSSPNTPGLRELQDKEPLLAIINKLLDLRNQRPVAKPIYLKIAPDLTTGQLDDIADIANQTALDGLVCTNTTLDRKAVDSHALANESGGLSGQPLFDKSTWVLKYLRAKTGKTIIGVGGIYNEASAQQKMDAGADLIQVYTGFIYEGPGLIKKLVNALAGR